ncbi:MAG TPA: DmsC/YnfH family molybdoenzyme membrane anchor subunit [Rudaea sp.]
MHPALSVIFFTTISGAGYGMLFLAALAAMAGAVDPMRTLVALAIGAVFAAAGLLSSTLHLGRPLRAWRAISQWRSSWLSREGVASLAEFVPLVVWAFLIWRGEADGAQRIAAVVLAILAVVTVVCTAKIYSTLKTIRAWHNGFVLPGYLLFALLGGAAWGWALGFVPSMLTLIAAVACVMLKLAYWRFIDGAPMAASAESATGLGRFGAVTSVEGPHTEENYLTREMGFVLARKHAAPLRAISLVLFGVVPVLACLLAMIAPNVSVFAAWSAALFVIAGTFVERWLFFAQAQHVVMLYYRAGSPHGG